MPIGRAVAGGIELALRVTPNAGADRIEGAETRDDGKEVLRVRVAAVPDKGRANLAAMTVLALAFDVPKSACTLLSGETSRFKTVRIAGDPAQLLATLARLTA